MTEPNNRVLGRMGARTLTEPEMGNVSGCATSFIITDVFTMFGKDFTVDHLET